MSCSIFWRQAGCKLFDSTPFLVLVLAPRTSLAGLPSRVTALSCADYKTKSEQLHSRRLLELYYYYLWIIKLNIINWSHSTTRQAATWLSHSNRLTILKKVLAPWCDKTSLLETGCQNTNTNISPDRSCLEWARVESEMSHDRTCSNTIRGNGHQPKLASRLEAEGKW